MAIKMRSTRDKEYGACNSCHTKYKNTRDMIDIMIGIPEGIKQQTTLCYKCYNELFNKLLKMQCEYQGKVKSKEDIERIQRENRIANIK